MSGPAVEGIGDELKRALKKVTFAFRRAWQLVAAFLAPADCGSRPEPR